MGEANQAGVFDEIQSICREFRKGLKAGQSVDIEEVLGRVDDSARENLFQNLLHIDVEFRRRRGESPNSDQYIRRFPQYASLIRQAFFESTMMSQEYAKDTPDSVEVTVTLAIPAARKLGDYELLRELGRGGFGVVYEARHLQRGDRLALKTLPMVLDGQTQSSRDAERLHRFRQEFRTLSEINHPNLAGMQTLEVDGNQWFFTMDLIDGVDFLQYVRPKGPLDEARLRASLKQLVRGITALHEQGIVHRDLKPSNVLVGPDGRVTILDFGLVAELQHYANETLSIGTQHFAGTPRYAAPEQASGQRSAAVDWYALGVMLFEAITGDAPFKGSAVDLLIAKQTTDPPLLDQREGVPQDLAQLVDSLLRRAPEERLSDQQVADALGVDSETRIHIPNSSSAESSLVEDSASGGDQFLVGRDSQLAELNSRLQHFSENGQSEAVFISGRSGEGKTSLAEAFLSGIRRNGKMLVLSGRCYDRESVPFKAIDCLIDPLVAYLRSRNVAELDPLLPDDIGMLAQLFPVLRRVEVISDRAASVSGNIDSRQVRYRAFSALRELLTRIGRRRPLVLFVDDLQWGDADSAAALHEVLRPPDGPAALLLGSYRSDEVDESQFLTEWQERQSDENNSIEQTIIEVAPLTEDECVLLISSRLGIAPDQLREQSGGLFEDTRGNPYFVEQLIEGFDAETNQFRTVPLDELIDRKLDRLPAAAKSLLEATAIAGQAASVAEVAAVADESASAFATLTHMRSERLVRLVGSDERQRVDTYHDKIRETALSGMPTSRRRSLHRAYAELLLKQEALDDSRILDFLQQDASADDSNLPRTGRIFDVAYHFHAAEDPRQFTYQMMAGELSFCAYASEDTVDFLERARASIPEDCPNAVRYRLYQRLATSYFRLRQFELALPLFEQALHVAPSKLSRATVHAGIAEIQTSRTSIAAAIRSYDAALTELGRKRPKGFRALLHCIPAALRIYLLPRKKVRKSNPEREIKCSLEQEIYKNLVFIIFEESVVEYMYCAFRIGDLAVAARDSTRFAKGVSAFAACIGQIGWPSFGRRYLGRAETIANEVNDAEARGVLLLTLAITHNALGNLGLAESECFQATPLLCKAGAFNNAIYSLHVNRHLQQVIGSSDAEIELGREVLSLATSVGNRLLQCWGNYDIASGLSRAGKLDTAISQIEIARDLLDRSGVVPITRSIFLTTEGYVQLQASDYEGATKSCEESWRICRTTLAFMEYNVRSLPQLIESILGPNWTTSGGKNSKQLRRLNRSAGFFALLQPNLRPAIERSRGRAFWVMGKRRRAALCFERAVKSASRLGADYDHARSLLDLAAIEEEGREENRREAIRLLKKTNSVIPHAEAWQLGDQYDPDVVAPQLKQYAQ